MTAISAADFADFFTEVHGYSPFAWQRELVQAIAEHGSWPDLVDVPTGLGKTTALDIAVFWAALDAHASYDARVGRRRIFFVVDRRIVVDQAEAHALKIAAHLGGAPEGSVSRAVADSLMSLAANHSPSSDVLPVVKMRGGVTWDAAWLSRPDVPGVVTGTVDQVGSRLLFRGYGVSKNRSPIDAALVGTDSLILVDEAHLAKALTTTLDRALQIDATRSAMHSPPPVVVQLSATATQQPRRWNFEFDAPAHLGDPVAARRLDAAKTLTLESTTKADIVKRLASQARDLAGEDSSRVLVVCNTIDRARAVHTALAKSLPRDVRLNLLIGRSRHYDREVVVEEVLSDFGADRENSPGSAVLVATQTVEVGIDLDATALVTECASWDALVQRIGRVNRRGAHEHSTVIVLDDQDPKSPVYGEARQATADYLRALGAERDAALDVSPRALRELPTPQGGIRQPAPAPMLESALLDAWARTSPRPANDPPVAPYLHGLNSNAATVTLVWRDGLLDAAGGQLSRTEAATTIECFPIRPEETVEVPISAVRRWLSDEKQVPISDEEADDEDWAVPFSSDVVRRVMRKVTKDGEDAKWEWASARQLAPGDTLVVPAEFGGLDAHGWAPESKAVVVDQAELAALDRGRPGLRIDRGLGARLGLGSLPTDIGGLVTSWTSAQDVDEAAGIELEIKDALSHWLSDEQPPPASVWSREGRLMRLAEAIKTMSLELTETPVDETGPTQQLSSAQVVLRAEASRQAWRDADDESTGGSSHLNRRVTLAEHHQGVGDRARAIAGNLGLPAELLGVVQDAARWHDLGKVDPRFQAMLFDGDEVLALLADEPMAKSGMPPGDLARHRSARIKSGLPRGFRHEASSEALVAAYVDVHGYAGDVDLLRHLIASHHGRDRPFADNVWDLDSPDLVSHVDGAIVTASVGGMDLSGADRFQRLNARYGRWGLALLESIVRCSDMLVSAEERLAPDCGGTCE